MKMPWKAAAVLTVPFILQGCGFGSDEAGNMDEPPEEVTEEIAWEDFEEAAQEDESSSSGDEKKTAEEETVERELYLIDENGMVAPQTFSLPKTEGVLKQSLEHLVSGGPISQMVPNGFQAVLPPGTEVDVRLDENGTAVTDFSPEFRDYEPEKEQAVLQAVTWTLTQFENVNDVSFQINGYQQETMPVNGTPIGETYSRDQGINLDSGSVSDMTDSSSVTVYFLSQVGENSYYVPVTRRISGDEEDNKLDAAMNELVRGPSPDSNLHSVFREGTTLAEPSQVKQQTASLFFNEGLLSGQNGSVSQQALHAVALTATELEGVENVELNVEGAEEVLRVNGKSLDEPLARPALVNEAPSKG
ncbi:GerMN domain-containing protein [Salibacterium halotolerans]|uniref:Germination protein M n=1 Tax=Salibacterium halotolerans TaxID=1884432 RepID=A0A1I5SPP7_9BACI|nr:GerMN domain-containing protein [Salibacterium halotolerans]SFP72762.1 germination protein M [Salibacterium halotolerans]